MSAPITSTQTPDNSILDLNGRQTYLGNSFSLPQAGKALTNTAETAAVVITNPAASGKSLFLFYRTIYSDLNPVLVRLYSNPVLNVPGATTAPKNMRSGSTTATVSVCYLSASITSNGTLVTAFPASPYGAESNSLYIIDPGNSVLLTGQQAAAGTSNVYIENVWYEI